MRCAYFASLCAVLVAAAAGCRSGAVEKDSAETLARLEEYQRAVADKDKLIKQLNARIDELDDGVLIKLEAPQADGTPGPIAEIVGRGPNARAGGGASSEPAPSDVEVYKAFVARVEGSLGRMRKCYEAALKKSSNLQARAIMLTIQVRFYTTGQVGSVTFRPQISPDFVRCATAVAKSWTLNKLPEAIKVEYQTRLKPQ